MTGRMEARWAAEGRSESLSRKTSTVPRMVRAPVRLEAVLEDRWLSVDEIAAHLGIKRDTVYKWISERQMPAHRVGRLWKFRKEEVDEWVRSGGAGERSDEGQRPLRDGSR